MDQYLLIPFLGGWTSFYQLFWGSLGTRVLTHPQINPLEISDSPLWEASRQRASEFSVGYRAMTWESLAAVFMDRLWGLSPNLEHPGRSWSLQMDLIWLISIYHFETKQNLHGYLNDWLSWRTLAGDEWYSSRKGKPLNNWLGHISSCSRFNLWSILSMEPKPI